MADKGKIHNWGVTFSKKKICQKFGISKATICQILKNQKTYLEAYDYYSKKNIEETQSKWANITKKNSSELTNN